MGACWVMPGFNRCNRLAGSQLGASLAELTKRMVKRPVAALYLPKISSERHIPPREGVQLTLASSPGQAAVRCRTSKCAKSAIREAECVLAFLAAQCTVATTSPVTPA